MLKINMEYNGGVLFVRLVGNLNRKTSYKLNNYLVPVIMKHGIKYLVYNLYELETIDSVGIKALVNGMNAINNNSGFAYMCEIPDALNSILRKTKIHRTKNELSALRLIQV